MSTTRNVLRELNNFSIEFIDTFDFYLDSLDKLFHYQSKIGFDKEELSQLSEYDQKLIKTYLFFVESSNTTACGVLRLLSSNIFSDAYSLIRINYEIGCLLHYGNSSKDKKLELYDTFFGSKESDNKQGNKEYNLVKKAKSRYEKEKPGLIAIRKELNNFGSHISKKKVVLGNIKLLNDSSTSSIFKNNFNNKYYLACLELLYFTSLMIIEEHTINCLSYNGVEVTVKNKIDSLAEIFLKNIRPKLQSMMNKT